MNNEKELLKLIGLLSDVQKWVDRLSLDCVNNFHASGIKLMNNKKYRLSIISFAHILEKHYHKILRYPDSSKFNISIPEILDYLKTAEAMDIMPIKGGANCERRLELKEMIGFNKDGEDAFCLVVITDPGGNIITAYPE